MMASPVTSSTPNSQNYTQDKSLALTKGSPKHTQSDTRNQQMPELQSPLLPRAALSNVSDLSVISHLKTENKQGNNFIFEKIQKPGLLGNLAIINPELYSFDISKKLQAPPFMKNISQSIPDKLAMSQKYPSWRLGFTFTPGISMTGTGFLNLNSGSQSSALDFLASSSMGNAGQPSLFRAPVLKNSFGFTTGIDIRKQFSAKDGFSVGLQYKYAGIISLVGDKISAGRYNALNSETRYQNHFHFVELPIQYYFSSGSRGKFSPECILGASVSQLIASNALQFHNGEYFKDNSFLNKTQFGLHAVILFPLISTNKFKLKAGPYTQYHLNSISEKSIYKNRHLNFVGLKTKIFFGK